MPWVLPVSHRLVRVTGTLTAGAFALTVRFLKEHPGGCPSRSLVTYQNRVSSQGAQVELTQHLQANAISTE